MSNIYFMCENCGIETNGITFVNGMKFCAKCYHQIFGNDNQQTEITQLKQQLAEKQKTIDEINKEFVQAIHDWKTLCAEKDKEIANLQVLIIENKNDIKEMREFKFGDNEYDLTDEDARNDIKNQLENQTQLAIQELEKVNGILTDTIIEVTHNEFDLNKLCYLEEISARFYEKMQEQIKELKGE